MNTEYEIRGAIHDLWRCHPTGPSTFSKCGCGRGLARGGYKCATCAEETLAALTTKELAAKYHSTVSEIRKIESEMIT